MHIKAAELDFDSIVRLYIYQRLGLFLCTPRGRPPGPPPFRCAELRPVYTKVVSANKVRRADQAHDRPVKLHRFSSVAEPFQVYLNYLSHVVRCFWRRFLRQDYAGALCCSITKGVGI